MNKISEKVRKVLQWKPNMRLVAVVSVAALLLLLVPLLRIAFYTTPWYDDYLYGRFVKNFIKLECSFQSAWQGALYSIKIQWYAWQGTFSSIFFMSMVPSVWGDGYYFWGPLFLITILPVAVFMLVGVLVRSVLKADLASCVILQSVTAVAVIVFIYSSRDGFFWYNSGIHYVGMHSFLMITAAVWIKLLEGKGRVSAVLLLFCSLIGSVLAGGANYVTALQGLLLIMSIFALGALLRKKRSFLLLPSLLLYAFAFYKNVSAPGNNVRKDILSSSGLGMDAISAIGNSFVEACRHMWIFTGIRMLTLMILLLPIIWKMLKKTEFRFRFPGLVLLWSFCFYATGFTPSLYSLGHAGVDRTLNAVKITWQILLLLNQVYWLGWLKQKAEQNVDDKAAIFARRLISCFGEWTGIPLSFYLVMSMLMLGIFAIEPNQTAYYSSYGAYACVHSGEAYEFYKEYLARVEAVTNGQDVVTVTPYHFKPEFLYLGDLTDDPWNEANRAMATWYGKQAIICQNIDSE